MSPNQDILDRIGQTIPRPDRPLEGFYRLRQRRRRNERIRAGAVGIGLVLLLILVAIGATRPKDRTGGQKTDVPPGEFDVLRYEDGGDLLAVDPKSGETRVVADGDVFRGSIGRARWSSDGRFVAFDAGGELWVVSHQETRRLVDRGEGLFGWVWSPTDARLAAYIGEDLVVIDARDGSQRDLGPVMREVTSAPAWSPDGTRLVFGARGGAIYSMDVASGGGSLLVQLPGRLDSIDGIEWAPDGSRIVILADLDMGPRRLFVVDADGSNVRVLVGQQAVSAVPDENAGGSWSRDGTLVYVVDQGGSDRELQIWTESFHGSAPHLVTSIPNRDCCLGSGPVWSPDGSQIGYSIPAGYRAIDADGSGSAAPIDELTYLSWLGGSLGCDCH